MGLGMVIIVVVFSSFGNVVAEKVMKSRRHTVRATVFHNSMIIHFWLVSIYFIYMILFDVIIPIVRTVSSEGSLSPERLLEHLNIFLGWNWFATATIATGFFTGIMSMLVLTYANNIVSLFAFSFNVAIIAVWELALEIIQTGAVLSLFEASSATFWLAVLAMLASIFVYAKSGQKQKE